MNSQNSQSSNTKKEDCQSPVRDLGLEKRRAIEENKVSPLSSKNESHFDSQQFNNEDQELNSQTSSLTQEYKDLVMSLPEQDQNSDIKILESINVCYFSNFDLNINDWFIEYENIEIFRLNMKKNLGATWLSFISEALDITKNQSLPQKQELIFTQIFNFYLLHYYSATLNACFKSQSHSNQMLDQFTQETFEFLEKKQYKIKDQNLLKPLLQTFYQVSLNEYQNILKKIESEEKYQIQLTEKALAQYDQMLRHEELMKREKILDEKKQEAKRKQIVPKEQPPPKKNYFPDFSIIKDKLIKPLLFATEKVVEYYFPEEQKKEEPIQTQQEQEEKTKESSIFEGAATKTTTDSCSDSSNNNELKQLKRKLQKLEINSNEDSSLSLSAANNNESPFNLKSSLKKRRFRQIERHNIEDIFDTNKDSKASSKIRRKSLKLNEKMLKKASATVDLISQKVKSQNIIQEKVTASFITNGIELTNEALETLQKNELQIIKQQMEEVNEQEIGYNINLRFIKPSKTFYSKQMSNWLRFSCLLQEEQSKQKLNPINIKKSFVPFSVIILKKQGLWKEYYMKPLERFAEIVINEYCSLKNAQLEEDMEISMCSFFDKVTATMLQLWEKEIIQKSSEFPQYQQTSIQ